MCEILQDYHWWWRSFLTGGCTAFYFFLYAIHFFYTKLTISGTASTFLYFGYTLIMVWLFFLFSGKDSEIAYFIKSIYNMLLIAQNESKLHFVNFLRFLEILL